MPQGRTLQVLSDLQEMSMGRDAKPDREHAGGCGNAHAAYDHIKSRMLEEFRKLEEEANKQEDPAITADDWETMAQVCDRAIYQGHRIDGTLNYGDSNRSQIEIAKEESFCPVKRSVIRAVSFVSMVLSDKNLRTSLRKQQASQEKHVTSSSEEDHRPHGRASRIQRVHNLGSQLFDIAEAHKSKSVIIFGHSLWLQTVFKELGTAETALYQHDKVANCGVVEMTFRRCPQTSEIKIRQANPWESPGYLGWNKKTIKEDFAAVERDYREEIKAHCVRLKQRLQLLSS